MLPSTIPGSISKVDRMSLKAYSIPYMILVKLQTLTNLINLAVMMNNKYFRCISFFSEKEFNGHLLYDNRYIMSPYIYSAQGNSKPLNTIHDTTYIFCFTKVILAFPY